MEEELKNKLMKFEENGINTNSLFTEIQEDLLVNEFFSEGENDNHITRLRMMPMKILLQSGVSYDEEDEWEEEEEY